MIKSSEPARQHLWVLSSLLGRLFAYACSSLAGSVPNPTPTSLADDRVNWLTFGRLEHDLVRVEISVHVKTLCKAWA